MNQRRPLMVTAGGFHARKVLRDTPIAAAAWVAALEVARREPGVAVAVWPAVVALLSPGDAAGWLGLLGLVATAAIVGLFTAAVAAARHGAGAAAAD